MSRALPLVMAFVGLIPAAHAEDRTQFVALVNPSGMLVRGPTELPGVAGYSPSIVLGVRHARLRVGLVGVLHLGAPTPGPIFSTGIRVSLDALRLHLPAALEAAVFGGVQVVARLGIPSSVFVVPTGSVGIRVMGIEFAVAVGPEIPLVSGLQTTWNLEAFSVAVNVPELIEGIGAFRSGDRFHGLAPP